jgi:hypothetical protein
MARFGAIKSVLGVRGGLDAGAATTGAARIMDGILAQQATVLAFERMFLFAGVAFLFVIPFALLLRRPAGGPRKPSADLH